MTPGCRGFVDSLTGGWLPSHLDQCYRSQNHSDKINQDKAQRTEWSKAIKHTIIPTERQIN
jgi:hypothetical protein